MQFLQAGRTTFNEPAWMDGSGKGILGFWTGALGNTASGAPIIIYDWYRNFLEFLPLELSRISSSYRRLSAPEPVGIGARNERECLLL